MVKLGYAKFQGPNETSTYNLHPYLLKEYRNRWYLLGWDRPARWIRTFGCDRIELMEILENSGASKCNRRLTPTTTLPTLGITVLGDGKPERIVWNAMPCSPSTSQSQPLPDSQRIREEGETHIVRLECHAPHSSFCNGCKPTQAK